MGRGVGCAWVSLGVPGCPWASNSYSMGWRAHTRLSQNPSPALLGDKGLVCMVPGSLWLWVSHPETSGHAQNITSVGRVFYYCEAICGNKRFGAAKPLSRELNYGRNAWKRKSPKA